MHGFGSVSSESFASTILRDIWHQHLLRPNSVRPLCGCPQPVAPMKFRDGLFSPQHSLSVEHGASSCQCAQHASRLSCRCARRRHLLASLWPLTRAPFAHHGPPTIRYRMNSAALRSKTTPVTMCKIVHMTTIVQLIVSSATGRHAWCSYPLCVLEVTGTARVAAAVQHAPFFDTTAQALCANPHTRHILHSGLDNETQHSGPIPQPRTVSASFRAAPTVHTCSPTILSDVRTDQEAARASWVTSQHLVQPHVAERVRLDGWRKSSTSASSFPRAPNKRCKERSCKARHVHGWRWHKEQKRRRDSVLTRVKYTPRCEHSRRG